MIFVHVWWWFQHFIGVDNASGINYLFWSGFGLSNFFYIGILYTIYRKINCHVSSCHRIGLHHVQGTPYVVCKLHHPAIANKRITFHHIFLAHRKANK